MYHCLFAALQSTLKPITTSKSLFCATFTLYKVLINVALQWCKGRALPAYKVRFGELRMVPTKNISTMAISSSLACDHFSKGHYFNPSLRNTEVKGGHLSFLLSLLVLCVPFHQPPSMLLKSLLVGCSFSSNKGTFKQWRAQAADVFKVTNANRKSLAPVWVYCTCVYVHEVRLPTPKRHFWSSR